MNLRCLSAVLCISLSQCFAQAVKSPHVSAYPTGDVLLRDPADTHRLVRATRLEFKADKTYRFEIRFSQTVQDSPPVRVVIYENTQHEPTDDCTKVVCWTEWLFGSSKIDFEGKVGQRPMKKHSSLLVIAWEGGNSKSRGGDPVRVECGGATICAEPMDSASNVPKLELTLKGSSQSAILEVALLP